MIKHFIILSFRNFKRYKSSFLINLTGLSTGLACALLIFLWVSDELNMDKFHAKSERLYQVMEHQDYAEGIMTTTSTPGLLAETLKDEIPEIEHAATITWNEDYTLSVEDKNIKAEGYEVGNDFFELFSYKLMFGSPEKAIVELNDIVLSEKTAISLFGSTENAIGQSLEINHDESFRVTDVFENVQGNSSMEFDFLFSFEKLKKEQSWLRSWSSNGPGTVVTLRDGTDVEAVNKKIADFVKERNENSNVTLFLKPYAERYLYGKYRDGKLVGGRIEYVQLFSIIAIFILIIACINFMNLSTAQASRRAKEVGVKKAVGADKQWLILQYLSESTLIAFLSMIIAIILVQLALPQFNLITDKEILLEFTPNLLGGIAVITLLTGLLAGSYPALYLSTFRPALILKGDIKSSLGELWARRGLVIFQFTLSVILIVAVTVVYQQVQFVQSTNLGYEKDNLITFSMDGRLEDQAEAFMTEAKRIPGVVNIGAIGHSLLGRNNNTSGLEWEGKDPEQRTLFENMRVSYDLIETIGVEVKEGRSFAREYGADSNKIIFNEKAIEIMGMENPIGQQIRLWNQYDLEIIGVVKNFHFQSLHSDMNPLFFWLSPQNTWNMMARIEAGKEKQAIDGLKAFYEEFNPGFAFDFEFMDQQYALQYAAEQRVASLSRYFAGFAILISCLGLFGLATFTADRRKKEIGIRKVLGATVFNIVRLITSDFTRLVLISIVIGLPIAYYVTSNWLEQFAYHINLSLWFFALAGILVMIISWLTVGSQAIRSANVNPKDCLRDE